MRTINQPAAAANAEGMEPTLLLEVRWTGTMGTRVYADKNLSATYLDGVTSEWQGRILSFSPISSQKRADNEGGMSTQCSFVLDDYDGELRDITDYSPIEGVEARVYHLFLNEIGAVTEIFRGRLSNATWSEGERTLSFEVVSYVESGEFGFQINPGEFGANNEVAYGRPWPFVFGKVAHVPGLLVQSIPKSTLKYPINLVPANGALYQILTSGGAVTTFDTEKLSEVESILNTDLGAVHQNGIYVHDAATKFPQGTEIDIEINGVIFRGTFSGNHFQNPTRVPKWTSLACLDRQADDSEENNPKVLWLARTDIDLADHWIFIEYQSQSTNPDNGTTTTTTQYFENICVRQEGQKCWFKYPFIKSQTGAIDIPGNTNSVNGLITSATTIHSVDKLSQSGLIVEIQEFVDNVKVKLEQRRKSDKNAARQPYAALAEQLDMLSYARTAFWNAPEGATVRQWNPTIGDVYVVNGFASNNIHSVYGLRTFQNPRTGKQEQIFTPIPKSYYQAGNVATGLSSPSLVTVVEFPRSLESYGGQTWAPDIWVTVNSTVTNNSVSIIKYLLDNYTDYSTDETSFTQAASEVANYPANFSIADIKDALELAQEIAWQSRCALIVDGPTIKIKYLSEDPGSSVLLLNEAKTAFQTISFGNTSVDQIITRLDGTYKPSLAPDEFEPVRTVYAEANVNTYGLRKQSHNFYIYNNGDLVQKSLDFWVTRLSNAWRTLHLETFTDAMMLEVFDLVTLSYPAEVKAAWISRGVVEEVEHNVHEASVKVKLWLPVIAGSTGEHADAWVSDALDSYPDNPADDFEEIDYAIHYFPNSKDVDEIVRELRKLQDTAHRLAKIVARLDGDAKGAFKVRFLENGRFMTVSATDVKAYDPNPQRDLRVGDIVEVIDGQDGVYYLQPVPFKIFHGTINEVPDDYFYKVKLHDYSAELLVGGGAEFEDTYQLSEDDFEIDAAGAPIETIVDVYNIHELEGALSLPPGLAVFIYNVSTTTGENVWLMDVPPVNRPFLVRLDGPHANGHKWVAVQPGTAEGALAYVDDPTHTSALSGLYAWEINSRSVSHDDPGITTYVWLTPTICADGKYRLTFDLTATSWDTPYTLLAVDGEEVNADTWSVNAQAADALGVSYEPVVRLWKGDPANDLPPKWFSRSLTFDGNGNFSESGAEQLVNQGTVVTLYTGLSVTDGVLTATRIKAAIWSSAATDPQDVTLGAVVDSYMVKACDETSTPGYLSAVISVSGSLSIGCTGSTLNISGTDEHVKVTGGTANTLDNVLVTGDDWIDFTISGSTLVATHADPGAIASSPTLSAGGSITGGYTINVDDKGHIVSITGSPFSYTPEYKVKVTAADTTEGYLDSKIVSGDSWIVKTVLNPAANESIQLTHGNPAGASVSSKAGIVSVEIVDVAGTYYQRFTIGVSTTDATGHVTFSETTVDVPLTKVTTVTAARYDTTTHRFQVKTQEVRVPSAGTESDWTDWSSGQPVETSVLEDIDLGTGELTQDAKNVYVLEVGTPSAVQIVTTEDCS